MILYNSLTHLPNCQNKKSVTYLYFGKKFGWVLNAYILKH